MATLREESVWTSPIYRIERNDPLMGGEYGINNVQARQLANRTRYLLDRFLAEHNEDGTHKLSEASIDALAAIAESKLKLDYNTSELYGSAQRCVDLLKALSNDLNSLELLENSSFGPLYQALLLSWKYGYPRFAFEIFTNAFTLRSDFEDVPIIESIAGDDSIDVQSTATLNEGETYILWDKDQDFSNFVTIKKILTDQRAVLYTTEGRTRNMTGVVSKSSWIPHLGSAKALPGSLYISGDLYTLDGLSKGNLLISHSDGGEFRAEVQRLPNKDATFWERLPLVSRFYSEDQKLWRTVYETPGGPIRFRIKALTETTVSHLVLMSDIYGTFNTTVRTPEVVDQDFTLTRFGALYGAAHKATHFVLCKSADFFTDECTYLDFGEDNSKLPVWDYKLRVLSAHHMEKGDEVYWRAWYDASDGHSSNMSGVGHYIHEALW